MTDPDACPITSFTILGQPVAKANSRRAVVIRNRPSFIKSADALAYVKSARLQIPTRARLMIDVPVALTMHLYYATRRPDLDESVILDVLQPVYRGTGRARALVERGVYLNDRLVRERHVFWGLDAENPRAEIEVRLWVDHDKATRG